MQERFHGGRVLAMKVMRKAHVVEKNQAEYMRTERDVLTRVEHPFIVLLHYSFQVRSCRGPGAVGTALTHQACSPCACFRRLQSSTLSWTL